MRHRVLGLVSCCIGAGMLLAVLMPAFGWVFLVALSLVGAGCFLGKNC